MAIDFYKLFNSNMTLMVFAVVALGVLLGTGGGEERADLRVILNYAFSF